MTKLVSIVISTWNRSALLSRTLESITKLQCPSGVDWECVVVNNASTDDTDAIVERFAQGGRIRSIYWPTPGLAGARNAGVREAKGDFILITDDDVLVDQAWLTEAVHIKDEHNADLVYGRIEPDWESGPPRWYSPLLAGTFGILDHGDKAGVTATGCGAGANHGFTSSAFQRLGGYNSSFGLDQNGLGGSEDEDLFQRAHRAGMVVAYQPNSRVSHFIPASRCSKQYLIERFRRGAASHFELLKNQRGGPTVAGIPRYFLRNQLFVGRRWLFSLSTGKQGDAFFYELRLRRFWQILRLAIDPANRSTHKSRA